MDWIVANYQALLALYASVVTIASIIVKLIPTLPEDSRFLPLVKFLAKFVALNTKTPENRP